MTADVIKYCEKINLQKKGFYLGYSSKRDTVHHNQEDMVAGVGSQPMPSEAEKEQEMSTGFIEPQDLPQVTYFLQ